MEEMNLKLAELSKKLKSEKIVEMPEWARFIRTGVSRERVPQDDGWWYIRSASILRKVYINGPIGTERLANHYGGRKNRGSRTDKFFRGSRKLIRTILIQLENSGLVEKSKTKRMGRILTKKGADMIAKVGLERP
ncbi:MAG: 40S ribosomal protein S19 [Candidatus Aenigmarchaeota archaeon]|nr:40S ribosomal protein S19 [Candidatus Aenigmarchaeota archaeon]